MLITEIPPLRTFSKEGVTVQEVVISKPGGRFGSLWAKLTVNGKTETCFSFEEAMEKAAKVLGN